LRQRKKKLLGAKFAPEKSGKSGPNKNRSRAWWAFPTLDVC